MTRLDFLIRFHTPFRVGGAYPSDGVDAAADAADPLPADSLKGVMRAAATQLLGSRDPLLRDVFGTTGAPAAWAWSGATPPDGTGWEPSIRYRVAIDPQELAALRDQLVVGEQLWTAQAQFTIERVRFLDPDVEARHRALLKVAAGAVHGIGAWRRRGLGWVHLTPASGPVTAADVQLVLADRGSDGQRPAMVGPAGGDRDG